MAPSPSAKGSQCPLLFHLFTLHTPALLDFRPANQERREETQRTAFLALWDPAPPRGGNPGHKGSSTSPCPWRPGEQPATGTSCSGGSQMEGKVGLASAPSCLQRLLGAGDSLRGSCQHQGRFWGFLGTFLWGGILGPAWNSYLASPEPLPLKALQGFQAAAATSQLCAKNKARSAQRPGAAVILQRERTLCFPSSGQEGEAGG